MKEIKYVGKLSIDVDYDYEKENKKKDYTKEVEYIHLNKKVQKFIEWFYDNMVKDVVDANYEYQATRELKDAIETVAVWYELRYLDSLVNEKYPFCDVSEVDVNDMMFRFNPYMKDKSSANDLKWNEFYNTNIFMNTLPWKYRKFLLPIEYPDSIFLMLDSGCVTIYLNKDGHVNKIEGLECLKLNESEINNIHIKDLMDLLINKGITLPDNNQLVETIMSQDKWKYINKKFLDCVMYRVIERGGSRIGPRRGLMFAKEFDRDKNIPMKYAIDYEDPYLMNLVNEFINMGGDPNLECYINYFDKSYDSRYIKTISLNDIINEYDSKKLVR